MSDPTPDNDKEIPEGMVKKVRRVKKKRRSSSRSSAADQQTGEDILREMHESDEDGGAVSVAEQVRRLQRKEDDDRPLDDVWGTKKRSATWLWVGLFAVIVPIISFGVFFFITENEEKQRRRNNLELSRAEQEKIDEETKLVTTKSDLDDGTALGWFQKNSHTILNRGRDILRTINQAKNETEILPLLRESPRRDIHPVKLADWGSPPQPDEFQAIRWHLESALEPGSASHTAMPVFVISGYRKDRSPFSAYFVRENDELKLDWEATLGLGEITLAEIAAGESRGNSLIRCILEKRPNMDVTIDGKPYSGYILLHPDTSDFVFAYIPTDDPISKKQDEAIKDYLNYGRLIGDIRQNSKVTLRVRQLDIESSQKYFEIVSFEHAGWVTP